MEFGLKTGDVIFCDYLAGGPMGWFSSAIKWFTDSPYSHCGVVLKDPKFAPVPKGYYVWESSYNGTPDPQDGRIKLGVQLTPFKRFYDEYKSDGKVFIRKLYTNNNLDESILDNIHDTVYNKPYDIVPKDWVQAYQRTDTNPQKTSRFWCSALVGYIYTKLGLYKPDTDWSIMRPSDIASDLVPVQNGYLGEVTEI